ncbi:MAG: DUF4369 domain-containing protein [Bacteroidales bacterium]|nr:DUF4369 domain-containing protein [Bacteroidales bacterium]
MKLPLITFLIFTFGMVYGQNDDFILQGTIQNIPENKVLLADYYGEKNTVLDSTIVDTTGNFTFSMSPELHSGMYKIIIDKENYIDFIYNK